MMREQGSDTQQAGKHTAFLRGMDNRSRYLYTMMELHHYMDQRRKERAHNTWTLAFFCQMGTISCMVVRITALERWSMQRL